MNFKTYIASLLILLFAGALDGMVEGWELDGRIAFEEKFNVEPGSYFGSLSWRKRYENPSLWNTYFGVWDFYHNADDARKLLYILGGLLIGFSRIRLSKFYWKHILFFTLAFMISGFAKSLAMSWIRSF